MKKLQLVSTSLLVLAAGACATTNVESVSRTGIERVQFERVAVVVQASQEFRVPAERKAVEMNHGAETRAELVASYQVFLPGREYSNAEMAERLTEHGIDAVLIIAPANAGVSSTPYVYYGETYASAGTMNKPWAHFQATLYDAATEEPVWSSYAKGSGTAFNDMEDVIRNAVGATIEKAREDGWL